MYFRFVLAMFEAIRFSTSSFCVSFHGRKGRRERWRVSKIVQGDIVEGETERGGSGG